MADKLRLGTEVRELKIGQSFTNTKAGAFHAVRYDFKPASVDINKIATVDIGSNNQVTVNVPHLDGAGVPQTVFKGSHRPFTKECVLIYDRMTGEITLEKLSSNIQVKKTRSETTKPILPQDRGERSAAPSNESRGLTSNSVRPQTPPIGQRQSNKTRVTSGSRRADRQITQLAPKHSPLRASPNYSSPGHLNQTKPSPKRDRNGGDHDSSSSHSQHLMPGSLPMIGIDDFPDEPAVPVKEQPPPPSMPPMSTTHLQSQSSSRLSSQSDSEGVAEMSDSSSSDSSSDSDSDHDEPDKRPHQQQNGNKRSSGGALNGTTSSGSMANGSTAKLPSLPTTLLNEDLCLSESGSDCDDD